MFGDMTYNVSVGFKDVFFIFLSCLGKMNPSLRLIIFEMNGSTTNYLKVAMMTTRMMMMIIIIIMMIMTLLQGSHETTLPVFSILPYTSHQQNSNICNRVFMMFAQVAAMNLETGPVVAVPFGTYGTVLGAGQEGRIQAWCGRIQACA